MWHDSGGLCALIHLQSGSFACGDFLKRKPSVINTTSMFRDMLPNLIIKLYIGCC
jgi:hypothetical protein